MCGSDSPSRPWPPPSPRTRPRPCLSSLEKDRLASPETTARRSHTIFYRRLKIEHLTSLANNSCTHGLLVRPNYSPCFPQLAAPEQLSAASNSAPALLPAANFLVPHHC